MSPMPSNLYPISRELWEQVVTIFQYFPLVAAIQLFVSYYPAGKTSIESRLNLPGKQAWISMEVPGFMVVLYCLVSIPSKNAEITSSISECVTFAWNNLPIENIILAALFVIHYIYRAIIGPLLNPSMSPIHISIWISAIIFQLMNGISIGGFLAGYGPAITADMTKSAILPGSNKSQVDWLQIASRWRRELGIFIWALGFATNIYHDEVLRDIRRPIKKEGVNPEEAEKHKIGSLGQEKIGKQISGKEKHCVNKLYKIPQKGLFQFILFPHYLCEWIEWSGWWIAGGSLFFPARTFLINEITTMLPRAIQGRNWYIERFGKEHLAGRRAIIPGLL